MVNTPEYPTRGTHFFMTEKFINGFSLNGLEVGQISNFNQVQDSEDQIFVMCDNFYDYRRPNWKDDFRSLAEKFKNTTWVFWTFHNVLPHFEHFPFEKHFFTGEYYRKPDFSILGENFKQYLELDNYVNLPFAANIHPEDVDSYIARRNEIYDASFVGCAYKKDWVEQLKAKFNCFAYFSPPFITDEDRLEHGFLRTRICLGFNADDNIKNGLPTERIFEGLAYGCVVLTDCKMAEEATDGIAVYVEDYQDLEKKVDFYTKNQSAREEKQRLGVEYAKNKGTYFHVAKDFLDKITN
jgi:hypothetical protein